MIGRQIGPYRVIAMLGAGGMGEVYRATDTRLRRDVAVKVLPEDLAQDPGRLARFEREARTLASLNHPNIAAIYGLERADPGEGSGRPVAMALVMELVEGLTLADRIAAGPVGVDEALAIGAQIAGAVEAAHERGIVHRDLKPSNIKVRPDGTVKVLDFGLAKALRSAEAGASQAPTITVSGPPAGPGPGTPAYMSPEQARGEPVDHRTDIWALGCVLYEMLAGRPAFEGSTVSDTLAHVLREEPDWTRLPGEVPPSIRRLLRLCLDKRPKQRRQSAGDVRIDLEQAMSEPEAVAPAFQPPPSRWQRLAWIGAVVAAALLAIPAVRHLREMPPPGDRLEVGTLGTLPTIDVGTLPTMDPRHFALSPDGRTVVYAAAGPSGEDVERLYLRSWDDPDPRPLPGTEGGRYPFWSPDSRSIGFFASERLFLIDVAAGAPEEFAPAPNPLGGSWNADGTILFAPESTSPLLRVSADGDGQPVAATVLDSPRQTNHRWPTFLPDGRRFLFYAAGEQALYLGSLDGGEPTRLGAADDGPGVFLPPDRVVFVQDGAVLSRRLDLSRNAPSGEPLPLVSAATAPADVRLSASATGTLALRNGTAPTVRMIVFDREGNELEDLGEWMNGPELSPDPDQRYIAFDRTIDGHRNVFILDRERGGDAVPFTTNEWVDGYPLWALGGSYIVYESQRRTWERDQIVFDIWMRPFRGTDDDAILLQGTAANEIPIDVSRDGRFVLYRRDNQSFASPDLLALPLPIAGDAGPPVPVAMQARRGAYSPDVRWVAYDTNESGRFEVYVQAFPDGNGSRCRVSTGGGQAPRWVTPGRIHYIAPNGDMMEVAVTTDPAAVGRGACPLRDTEGSLFVGTPERLFFTNILEGTFKHQYAVSNDGERFLVANRQADARPAPIHLVLNWRP